MHQMRCRTLVLILGVLLNPCAVRCDQPAWQFTARTPPAPPPGMVYVPAGVFVMGTDQGVGDETPRRTPNLAGFYIDIDEVTNGDYARFVTAAGHRPPQAGEGEEPFAGWRGAAVVAGQERYPVACVDWEDAQAYATWAGKSLPTEAEWEKAARGTDGRAYPWGNTWDPARCNFITDGPLDVGSFPAGASPYGCRDMAGNVWEWTASYYLPYPGNEQRGNDPYGKQYRVMRGGSWNDHCMYGVRCYARAYGDPLNRLPGLGLRCALSAPKLEAFEGTLLPAEADATLGRQLIEALARALPGWHGKPGAISVVRLDEATFTATIRPDRTLVIRRGECGVWLVRPPG